MRVTNASARRKRKRKVLDAAKGAFGRRSNVYRRAVETVRRAGVYAYRDRKVKKRTFRGLWIVRINAAVRERGMAYRTFMHGLKQKNILLTRDVLAKIAAEQPKAFDKLVELIKN